MAIVSGVSCLLLILMTTLFLVPNQKLQKEQNIATNTAQETRQQVGESNPDKKILTPTEQSKVDRLLKVAKAHLLVQRLIAPQGSNAYDAFHLILDIDPENQEALAGLELVEEKLVERVQALELEGNQSAAGTYFDLAKSLFPQSAFWQQAR